MKNTVVVLIAVLLSSCIGKTGKEEKELATKAFLDCDFRLAIETAELAINYAGDNVEVVVPSLLIIGKSSEFLELSSSAYDEIVDLAPGIHSTSESKKIADKFVSSLSKMAPEKVKACKQLQS